MLLAVEGFGFCDSKVDFLVVFIYFSKLLIIAHHRIMVNGAVQDAATESISCVQTEGELF